MADRVAQLRLRLTAKVAQYHLQSVVDHRGESSVKVQARKVAARDPKVSDSATRQHQQARVHTSVAHLSIGRSPPARLQAKQAEQEKESRALIVNPAGRRRQEAQRPLLAGQPEVEHLPLAPSTARASLSVERKSLKKNHRRQGHNDSGIICDSGFGNENSGAAFSERRLL
jgi:hypothetical protein